MDSVILSWLKQLLPHHSYDSITELRNGIAFSELLHLVSEEEFPR